ncbi:MAG: glycosyltransferase family 2 protein [Clostridia bacterium]|nr:glycosyltransferase family 2 protein [Clostridia bacterium]
MKVLIIIPAYNEALNIEKTVKDIKTNTNYDYIVINDCSKDNTKQVCERNNFHMLSLPINYGLTSAIQVGMKYAYQNNYDIAIQFDGDGQHQAKYLKDLVNEIESGNCEIAIGSRFVERRKPHSLRMLGSNLISLCIKLTTGKKIKDTTSGMRAYNGQAIEEFVKNPSLTPEPDTIVYMIKRGMNVKEVQVEMSDREFGESYLKPIKAMEYMFNMIFSILFIRSTTKKKKGGK